MYFGIGRKISLTAKNEASGSKALQQIADALQNELPGLRGFSSGNLKKMRVFTDFWEQHLSTSSKVSNQIIENFTNTFFSVSFSHHYLTASKSSSFEEVWFYLFKTASEFLGFRRLEKLLKENLYKQQGTLPNNFNFTLAENCTKRM